MFLALKIRRDTDLPKVLRLPIILPDRDRENVFASRVICKVLVINPSRLLVDS